MTGAGLSYALAGRFAEEGAKVVIADSNQEAGKAAAKKLKGHFEPLDTGDAASVERAVEAIAGALGRIDVWINNPNAPHRGFALDLKPEDWDADMATILSGSFYCARAAGRVMVSQKSGSIVNLASVNGLFAQKAAASDGAANAGLIMLTKVLASEWAAQGVRVNAVAPGAQLTAPPEAQTYLSRIPMGRTAEVNEVVEAVTFLASDEASYMTGETLRVDGGWTAYHLFHPFEEAF